MGIKVDVYHHILFETGQLDRIEVSLSNLIKQGKAIMNDLTNLQQKFADLEAKSDEVVDTLTGLAQAIVDLKASGDVQAGIDDLANRAQAVLDKLGAAEDAADDQLPAA
jgi:chromosome segregation ATPase